MESAELSLTDIKKINQIAPKWTGLCLRRKDLSDVIIIADRVSDEHNQNRHLTSVCEFTEHFS